MLQSGTKRKLAVLAGAIAMVMASGVAQAKDQLVAGVEASFPPWAYVKDGKFKGIAIDAMRKIAADQGLDVKFKDLPWPSLIPALSHGKIDVLVTGLNVTRKRAKVLDFTIPWWENDDEILVPTDSDKNAVTALCCGATVGAQSGSTQFEWLRNNVVKADGTDLTLRGYEDYVTAVEDMQTGRITSVVTSTDTANDFIAKGRPVKIVGTIQQNQPQALAVKEGDPDHILGKLNAGIMDIYKSGEWAKIVHSYRPDAKIRTIPTTMPDYVDSYKKPIPGYNG